jgi:hypothetical protein
MNFFVFSFRGSDLSYRVYSEQSIKKRTKLLRTMERETNSNIFC